MSYLIDKRVLYKQTAEWEAQALAMVEKTMHDEDPTEWRRWSAVLTERTAFKHDVADAPTIEAIPVTMIEGRIKDLKKMLMDIDPDDVDNIWHLRTEIQTLTELLEIWEESEAW